MGISMAFANILLWMVHRLADIRLDLLSSEIPYCPNLRKVRIAQGWNTNVARPLAVYPVPTTRHHAIADAGAHHRVGMRATTTSTEVRTSRLDDWARSDLVPLQLG